MTVIRVLPIWPSLHLGCATTLPPIQKNSSASLDMDAFCQSLGELIMDGVGEGLEACFAWWEEPLASKGGGNIPDDKDPKDWKLVFLGDREDSGWLPPSPGDRGAIGGVMFIPESYIWVQLSCPIHATWTHLPPHSAGLISKVSLQGSFSHAASKASTYPSLPVKVFPYWIRKQYSQQKVHLLVILCSVIQFSSHGFLFYSLLFICTEGRLAQRKCATCVSH